MKIAFCGKGGVGKSTIAALLCGALLESGYGVLAIDADPSPHLGRLLGFAEAESLTPLAEMRDLLAERAEKQGPYYNLNPKIDDLPEKFMLKKDGLRLMVLGAIREAGGGCACPEQTVLRRLLSFLILQAKEAVVVDMEAGVEHFGRATVVPMDFILVVAQPYRGSLETAKQILRLSQELKMERVVVVGNAVRDTEDEAFIQETLGVEPLVSFPEDREVLLAERKGKSLLELPGPSREKARELVKKLSSYGT
ncbi:AAA family ATPase [Thermosulfurimonas dismutans]|uniref:CO dehydrogenase accessory protein CooC (Nickel insertion) n=1 Tax=Thermosulfurimonas dismutans TaxID=999894 RepID=A0A179D4R9_9BACT|nr:P-loop NTPase [Thermosulfurimonas dismutans]OAQ21036.1 CO dehydrogenase accessory protein CooC (nickel insertion) [Thermosulfurimonas dismutans]